MAKDHPAQSVAPVDYVARALHNADDPLCDWADLPDHDTAYGPGKERRRAQVRAVSRAIHFLICEG